MAVFLLHGEDPFRTRLRLVELVRDLLAGGTGAPGNLSMQPSTELGAALGVTRHDARSDRAAIIAMSGQSQGLFALADEKRVIVVENAEELIGDDQHVELLGQFPPDAALVLITLEKLAPPRARRAPARSKAAAAKPAPGRPLPEVVESAGGRVERVERLMPGAVAGWIQARAQIHGVTLAPAAVAALAELGSDTERAENEIAKLGVWAQGATVQGDDVRRLVSGAIESDVFKLTEAVVNRDLRAALANLDLLLADGQAVLQILSLLLWQFRVLLFASSLERGDPKTRKSPEDMAKAIRSSPGAILRWRQQARRVRHADIVAAYESLYATDIAIKSGRVESDAAALMLCVLDLCGVGSANMRELVEAIPAPRRS